MSTLNSSMNIAVSALLSESAAVSNISNNLANTSTVGYKTTTASFASLVSGSGSYTSFTGAGVSVDPTQDLLSQGTLVGTNTPTNLAVDGDGWFVVSRNVASNTYYYTRAGDFSADDSGYLVNGSGYYLMGWATDRNGNITSTKTASGLSAINVEDSSGTAAATTTLDIKEILPADATATSTYTQAATIYDSLGTEHTLTITYTKTAANTWTAAVATTGGTVALTQNGATVTTGAITFNDDGTLSTTSGTASSGDIHIGITWTNGAANSAITWDLGTAGSTDGLSQYTTTESGGTPALVLKSITQDGLRFGSFTGVSIDQDGTVYAKFTNGISYPIYVIPLAQFANDNGLDAKSGTVYSSSAESGAASLAVANYGAAGAVQSGEVESSTADTATEFSALIVAQQAYSAASEVISTVQTMYENLMSAKR